MWEKYKPFKRAIILATQRTFYIERVIIETSSGNVSFKLSDGNFYKEKELKLC